MTRVPKGINARRLVKALLEDGFILIRTRGSHRRFFHPSGRLVTVSYHHLNDTFPIGTLKGMIEDAGWNENDLKRLELL